MKIIEFKSENFKRLKAVEISPDGTIQVITGRNAQGKSSVLDAIWLALGGGHAARSTAQPIRDGEDEASVTLDLGDLTVTRTWKGERTTLTVMDADGNKYRSPQSVLDGLVGRLSFDPLEFTRQTDKEQLEALLSLVDLPFDLEELDEQRADLYDSRTSVGRQRKALGAPPAIDDSLSPTETSATELLAEIRAASDVETASSDAYTTAQNLLAGIEAKNAQIARLTYEVEADGAALEQIRAAHVPPTSGLAELLEVRLLNVEQDNRAVRANNAAREAQSEIDELSDTYATLTSQIEALDRQKADGLAAATFPVNGLGFDESGVTYLGIPFSQSSSAEQIKVSLAMAMSLNPELRVIRIMDGSLLDQDSLAMIASAASAADYQIWVEKVGDGSEGGVVIEDGEVVS